MKNPDNFITNNSNDSISTVSIILHEINMFDILDEEEERNLAKRIKEGDEEAFEELVNHNLRLACWYIITIKKINPANSWFGDYYAEACEGLTRAAKVFDPDKGSFSAIACMYMNKYVTRFERTVFRGLTEDAYSRLIKIMSITSRYESNGVVLNTAEIAIIYNDENANDPIDEQEVISILNMIASDSLDNPSGEDGKNTVANTVAGNLPSPEDYTDIQNRNRILYKALDLLRERDRKMVILYFGLYDIKPMTYAEISEVIGTSKETVRRSVTKSLTAIRDSEYGKTLSLFR